MLSFVPGGREHLAKSDKRGAILNVATVEQERTARRRLIVVDFIVGNFRRHERHRRDDPLLRVMRKMNSVVAADESRTKSAAGDGRQRCGDDMDDCAAIEWCDLDLAGRTVGAIRRGDRSCPQSNKDEQARKTGNCADRPLVRKAITFADQAGSAVTEAAESRRDWSLPNDLCSMGIRRVGNDSSLSRITSSAGASMPVHKCLCTAGKPAGDESPVICGCCEAATMATKSSTRRGFAELLGELLVDTAAVACASRCRTRAYRCPIAIRMPKLSESVTRIKTLP
jgi:hypothetical protein